MKELKTKIYLKIIYEVMWKFTRSRRQERWLMRSPVLREALLSLQMGSGPCVLLCSHSGVNTLLWRLALLLLLLRRSFHFSRWEIQRCVVYCLCITILQTTTVCQWCTSHTFCSVACFIADCNVMWEITSSPSLSVICTSLWMICVTRVIERLVVRLQVCKRTETI